MLLMLEVGVEVEAEVGAEVGAEAELLAKEMLLLKRKLPRVLGR